MNLDFSKYIKSCTLVNPVENGISFYTDKRFESVIENIRISIGVLLPEGKEVKNSYVEKIYFPKDQIRDVFITIHNALARKNGRIKRMICNFGARVHHLAYIGADGIRFMKTEQGLERMEHIGGVILCPGVEIGPYTVVARGTIDDTQIKRDAKIGYNCNIGHNAIIGERTIIVDGATLGGSCRIGDDCWIGMNSTIREGVWITDKVLIGMGAVVTKDISEPGKYAGCPARRLGDWDGEW